MNRLLPTAPHLYRADDYRTMPWKNGGGSTCELLRLPHPVRPDDFALRLSIATVSQGGPFSAFPGVDRTLYLLDGDGMALQFADGRSARLDQALARIDFAGEVAVDCQLLGARSRDFNVMVARDTARCRSGIHAVDRQATLPMGGDGLTWVYLLHGSLTVSGLSAQAGELLALPQQGCEVLAQAGSRLIEIQLLPA
ncbi:HutD family protein, partial [Chitinimonas sp.]|uniref:HutD/Ves family protein n=1 Tax=Chitinimonas sp. TaxID=1934313 RepID=UPI0035B1363D